MSFVPVFDINSLRYIVPQLLGSAVTVVMNRPKTLSVAKHTVRTAFAPGLRIAFQVSTQPQPWAQGHVASSIERRTFAFLLVPDSCEDADIPSPNESNFVYTQQPPRQNAFKHDHACLSYVPPARPNLHDHVCVSRPTAWIQDYIIILSQHYYQGIYFGI